MKISEILKKVLEGKELTDAEKEALKTFKEPEDNSGKETELQKQIDALKQEKSELQSKIDEAENAKLTDQQKLEKQIETLNGQVAALTKERDSLKTANAAMSFDHGVEKLAREHKFTDVDFLKFKIQNAKLDISKADKVTEFMTSLKKDSPRFFEAEVNHGGGGSPTGKENGGSDGVSSRDRLAEIMKKENPSAAELAEAMKLSTEIKAQEAQEAVDGQPDNKQ